MKQRLQNRLQEIERERLEVQEMLRVINDVPRVLGKSSTVQAPVDQPKKSVGRTVQNRNVTELVRQYIDGYEREKVIDVSGLVKRLQEQGVKGKYRSLYSAVHVILKKETKPTTDRDQARLAYEKGVGFFKPRQSVGDAM
jgi:hypothetical protein